MLPIFFLPKKYFAVFGGSELFGLEELKNKPGHSFCAEFHELFESPIKIKKSDVENPQKRVQRGSGRTTSQDRIYAIMTAPLHYTISMLLLFPS